MDEKSEVKYDRIIEASVHQFSISINYLTFILKVSLENLINTQQFLIIFIIIYSSLSFLYFGKYHLIT